MAFPASLDDLSTTRATSGTDKLSSPDHLVHHAAEDTLIEAIQTKVGVDSSAVVTSLDYLVKNPSSINPGHLHNVLAALDGVPADAVYVDAAGNVGIGTTGPSEKLEINGNLFMGGGDIKTDRWLESDTNTLIGVGVAGAGNLSHSSGLEGWYNTAVGNDALNANTTGYRNSALGFNALKVNTTGYSNSALGFLALSSNTEGYSNSALGDYALLSNTTGDNNSAIGYLSLRGNTTGDNNSAIGSQALMYTQTGSNNTAVGYKAGYGVNTNSFSNNVFLGYQAGDNITTGANNIVIGYDIDLPTATSANTLNIGNLIFATGVDGTGTTLSSGNVGIGITGPLGKCHIDQSVSDAAIPVLVLDQADVSEGFINFLGASAASAVGPISTWTAGNTIQGFVRVEINSAQYWAPYYDAPTS